MRWIFIRKEFFIGFNTWIGIKKQNKNNVTMATAVLMACSMQRTRTSTLLKDAIGIFLVIAVKPLFFTSCNIIFCSKQDNNEGKDCDKSIPYCYSAIILYYTRSRPSRASRFPWREDLPERFPLGLAIS